MMLASDTWYDSPNFWAIAGVAAVVLVGLAGAWIGWVAVNPKRRLFFSMPTSTRLLHAKDDVRRRLRILHGEDLLTDPYVLEVMLIARGRLDIPSSAFDKDRPLVLDVGATIIEVLQATTTPGGAVPGYGVDGSMLRIGPDRIGRRQKITFSLLADGPAPHLTCPEPPLNDVDIREQVEDPDRGRYLQQTLAVQFVMIVMVAIVAAFGPTAGWMRAAIAAAAVGAVAVVGITMRIR